MPALALLSLLALFAPAALASPRYPWQASFESLSDARYQCAGVLIAPDVVLTSAMCTTGVLKSPLKLGAHHAERDAPGTETRRVVAIVAHDLFPLYGSYDIALMLLDRPSKRPVARLAGPDDAMPDRLTVFGTAAKAQEAGVAVTSCDPLVDVAAYYYPWTPSNPSLACFNSTAGKTDFANAVFRKGSGPSQDTVFAIGTFFATTPNGFDPDKPFAGTAVAWYRDWISAASRRLGAFRGVPKKRAEALRVAVRAALDTGILADKPALKEVCSQHLEALYANVTAEAERLHMCVGNPYIQTPLVQNFANAMAEYWFFDAPCAASTRPWDA